MRASNRNFVAIVLLGLALFVSPLKALALIEGGEGNDPITNAGWPKGAAETFNSPARIAFWSNDAGQSHSECRGDAKALSEVLAHYAKMEAKEKRVIVYDGVGRSNWLNLGRNPEKAAAARIDWVFMVREAAPVEGRRRRIGGLAGADFGPLALLSIYAGGNIAWKDVKIPEGLTIVDNRLEAHGYKLTDGNVVEGMITDGVTKTPLEGSVVVQRIEPQPKGGYVYTKLTEAKADKTGKWAIKNTPQGWLRIVAQAEGYVPLLIGQDHFDDQPGWQAYAGALAKPGVVEGRIVDGDNKPLAGVDVRLGDVIAKDLGRYDSLNDYVAKTDAEGRFRFDQVPLGSANVTPIKPGYIRLGTAAPIPIPTKDVTLQMAKSATAIITVGFGAAARPKNYIVNMTTDSVPGVSNWGGTATINDKNQYIFKDIPPGKYVLYGHPNPYREDDKTEPIIVELKAGEKKEIVLTAKEPAE